MDNRSLQNTDDGRVKFKKVFISKQNTNIILLYFTFTVLMVATIFFKTNYHMDEIYSYGLSNHVGSLNLEIVEGVRYEPVETPFLDYITVDENARFNYSNVWANQTADVHPPAYYTVLHTICSFRPETFSKWYAGIINIVFAILTLYHVRKIVVLLTDRSIILSVVSIAFICSGGILSAVSFFRMYIMAMFFVTYLAYLLLNQVGKENSIKFYLLILLVNLGGALTHYYFIVFSVIISFAYGLYLITSKRWSNMFLFIGTMIVAGWSSYKIFPAMIIHMFHGYHGTRAMENLLNLYDYWDRLKNFFNIIDKQLFGKTLGYILAMLFFMVIIYAKMKMTTENEIKILKCDLRKEKVIRYFLLIFSSIIYYCELPE